MDGYIDTVFKNGKEYFNDTCLKCYTYNNECHIECP